MKRKLTDEQHAALLDRSRFVPLDELAKEFGIHKCTAQKYLTKRATPPKTKPTASGSGQIAGPVYACGYRTAVWNIYSPSGRRHGMFW